MIDETTWQAGFWLNEPREWHREPDGSVAVVVHPHTDFWRLTHDGGLRHSGHVYGVHVAGDFTATVAVRAAYRNLYDQAGLMACADETRWLKAGVEFFEGVPRLSCVVTRDSSDWSLGQRAADTQWIRLQRTGSELALSFSADGSTFSLARQCTLAVGAMQVGLQCCAPGESSFVATFTHFTIEAS